MSRIKKEFAKLRSLIDMITIAKLREAVKVADLVVLLQIYLI